MIEGLPSEAEIAKERTPRALLRWVEETFDRDNVTEAFVRAIRLRRGRAKQLVEEIYPLATYAARKYGDSESVWVKPVLGNQNYDAVLTDRSHCPALVSYVEVTQAHEGETEHLRAVYLDEHGYVPGTGPVHKTGTKKTGLHVSPELEAVPVVETAHSELRRIAEAVKRKESKAYPDSTCLVVTFDDGPMFREVIDEAAIDQFVVDNLKGLDLRFSALCLVGKHKHIFREYALSP
jgi:hypothetical protein